MRLHRTGCLLALLLPLAAAAFDLQGHRGARGLAPENTLPAFARALEVGVTTLELDIGVTADGQVVVAHDPVLNPAITRDASGQWVAGPRGPRIRDLTLAQLRAYDVGRLQPDTPYARTFALQQPADGARIPTLAEVVALVRERRADHVRFNIETKISPKAPEDTVSVEAMVDALLQAVRDLGIRDRTSIQSFDWRSLARVQERDPGLPTVYLTSRVPAIEEVPQAVRNAGGRTWSPRHDTLTPTLLREARALGLAVVPWTVNEVGDMERMLDWGVDGLITDYPDRLRAVLAQRGMPLPPQAP